MSEGSEDYFSRLVDEDRLAAYLRAELGAVDEYDVRHHKEGHSNETLFVTWGELELVIRRPPPGEVAESAHDVLREYRVMDALQETAVPVPRTVLGSEDHDVMGSDFYVMGRAEGDVLRSGEPDRFQNADARRTIGEEMIDTLVAIHQVDYEAVGLGELGYPPGFTQRQVDRWAKQLMWAFEVTTDEREVPELYDVTEWLSENVPADDEVPSTLVHGDFKLDNVMFGPADTPEIAAVFDWEMSTLGDPFTDLGWMLTYWWDEKDPAPPDATDSLNQTFMATPDYPTREELVARYEELTGWTFEHERFYRVLAVYKLAGLGEMFFRRHLEGNSDDPLYPKMRTGVPELAKRAMRIIEGDEPL